MRPKLMTPPDGTYQAVAGGYVSVFQWSIYQYRIKFPMGVRGVGIKDTITVIGNEFNSTVLGTGGKLED